MRRKSQAWPRMCDLLAFRAGESSGNLRWIFIMQVEEGVSMRDWRLGIPWKPQFTSQLWPHYPVADTLATSVGVRFRPGHLLAYISVLSLLLTQNIGA